MAEGCRHSGLKVANTTIAVKQALWGTTAASRPATVMPGRVGPKVSNLYTWFACMTVPNLYLCVSAGEFGEYGGALPAPAATDNWAPAPAPDTFGAAPGAGGFEAATGGCRKQQGSPG